MSFVIAMSILINVFAILIMMVEEFQLTDMVNVHLDVNIHQKTVILLNKAVPQPAVPKTLVTLEEIVVVGFMAVFHQVLVPNQIQDAMVNLFQKTLFAI